MSNFPDFSSHGYQVIRELARNREAGRITYLATNLNLDQKVTIKEFRFASEGTSWSGFKAYQREIELLQQLDHPRIPRYFNSFETPSGFCLVQEYKNAPSLAERRSFTPEEIRTIAISVLEILVYLQKRIPPVIHRDIKPENILVDEQLNAYLVDFGLARIGGEQMALSSVAAGTPGFMPPEEQFGRPLSEASDLYSLGATLMCLVTGTRSVNIGTLINDEYRFNVEPLVPQLSYLFVAWLTKMVEPNVKKRFANAEQALLVLIDSNKLEASKPQKGLYFKVLLLYGLIWVSIPALGVHLMQSVLEHSMNRSQSNQINNSRRNYHQTYRAPQTNYRNRDVKWDATYWFNTGEYLFRHRRYYHALSAYNAAIKINPNHYRALVGRCATLNQILKYEKALVDCNKAIEISPNNSNSRVWVTRGHALAGMGKYEESIASYDRAIQINPNYKENVLSTKIFDTQVNNANKNYPRIPPTPKPFCPSNRILPYRYSSTSMLNWETIPGAITYTLELDYSIPSLGWCSEKDRCKYTTISKITKNWHYPIIAKESNFSPPIGRWRVWAVDANGKESPKSAWCELRYTQ